MAKDLMMEVEEALNLSLLEMEERRKKSPYLLTPEEDGQNYVYGYKRIK